MKKNCRLTVVGDGAVGKTRLLLRYTQKEIGEEYVPTVFEDYRATQIINGTVYDLEMWDTAGQEGYDKLRAVTYQRVDIFLICYDVNNDASIENCKKLWLPELKKYTKNCRYVLIGTKMDLCSDVTAAEKAIKKLNSEIKAEAYFLTSSITGENVEKAINEAVLIACTPKKLKCSIL